MGAHPNFKIVSSIVGLSIFAGAIYLLWESGVTWTLFTTWASQHADLFSRRNLGLALIFLLIAGLVFSKLNGSSK